MNAEMVLTQNSNGNVPFSLTQKELDCLYYLVRGLTAKGIGQKLFRSPRTVEQDIVSIRQKFGCHSKGELIARIFDSVLIKLLIDKSDLQAEGECL